MSNKNCSYWHSYKGYLPEMTIHKNPKFPGNCAANCSNACGGACASDCVSGCRNDCVSGCRGNCVSGCGGDCCYPPWPCPPITPLPPMPWPPAPCPPAPEPGIKAEFSFTKVSQEGQPLSGAKFVMIDQNGRSCEATSGLDGKVTFQGLKFPMFYGLHEAQAPAGYQRPCDDMRNSVWIDRYGQIYFNGLNYGPDGPRVVNMPCVC